MHCAVVIIIIVAFTISVFPFLFCIFHGIAMHFCKTYSLKSSYGWNLIMRDIRSIARAISNNLLLFVTVISLPIYLDSALVQFYLSYILFLCSMTQLASGAAYIFKSP